MRIGIDIRAMTAGGLGRGLASYATKLVEALVTLEPQHEFYLFAARQQPLPDFLRPPALPPHVQIVRLRRPTRTIFFWDQLCWYPLLRHLQIDVFHSLIYGVPVVAPCPTVLTIHDLTPLLFPQVIAHLHQKLVFRFNFWTATHAARVIAVSRHTSQDVRQYLHIPADRIEVVHEGVDARYAPRGDPQADAALKARYGIPDRFVLYVGGFDPNKNLLMLVQAFRRLAQDSSLAEPVTLVLVGNLSPAASRIQAEVQSAGLADRVIFTGFVPEDELVRFYNAADLFVFPSLYEGFGLPPLEAMACGTPVVVSNAASLPEVVGEAAIQIDPRSPQALCDAMRTVLTDAELRTQLRQRGLIQARQFTWQEAARQTLAVYERCAYQNSML